MIEGAGADETVAGEPQGHLFELGAASDLSHTVQTIHGPMMDAQAALHNFCIRAVSPGENDTHARRAGQKATSSATGL